MVCPCAMIGCGAALCSAVPEMLKSPIGRASAVALLPFLFVASLLYTSLLSMDELTKTVNCVCSCSSMCSWVAGFAMLYAMGIKKAYTSVVNTSSKNDDAVPVVAAPPKAKLAAKAA